MCTRQVDGRTVEFGTSGYTMDHVFVLYDRDTESVWYPMSDGTLDAVAGSRHRRSLPFVDKPDPMPLRAWLDLHPGSLILVPSESDVRRLRGPILGVRLEQGEAGVFFGSVLAGGPADDAGLLAGDILRKLGGVEIAERRDIRSVMAEHEAGDAIELEVERDGEAVVVEVTLGSRSS